jgi:hypothetical protein
MNRIRILVVFLICVNLSLLIYIRQSKIEFNSINSELKLCNKNNMVFNFKHDLIRKIFIDHYSIKVSELQDITLADTSGENIFLSTLIRNSAVVIVRFSQQNCNVCVDSLI